MGNRAVITTKRNWQCGGVGIYLHWNGGRDSVEAFLKYCELKGYRAPDKDGPYGMARLCQVIANFFGGTTDIGIGSVYDLDCNNYDNGVYIIDGWEIVDRKYFKGEEQNEYDLDEFMLEIDNRMPVRERIKGYLQGKEKKPEELKIGDKIVFLDWGGQLRYSEVIGIGLDRFINGTNVKGIPYIDLYGTENPEDNINNYLRDGADFRVIE